MWAGVLNWSRVGLNAVVFLVLSRWLTLQEIGSVAAAQAPVIFLQQVISSIFPDLVIQRRRASAAWTSTLFWFSLVGGLICLCTLALVSGLVAMALGDRSLGIYMLILAPCPLFYALGGVPDGLLRKALDMKALALRTTFSTLIAGAGALTVGYLGGGAWSLVFFTLANSIIGCIAIFAVCDWRPSCVLRVRYLRGMFLVLAALAGRYALSAAVIPVLQFATMFTLGSRAAGIYQIAQRVYTLIDSVTLTPIRFIALPIFSRAHHDLSQLSQKLEKALAISSIIAIPAYLGALSVSKDILPILVGDKNGAPAAPILMILCLYGPFGLATNLISHALTSVGLAGVVFRRTVWMLGYALIPCLIAVHFSLSALAFTYTICGGWLGFLIALMVAKHRIGTSVRRLVGAMAGPMIAGLGMATIVISFSLKIEMTDPISKIVFDITLGVISYIVILSIFARNHMRIFYKAIFPSQIR